MSFVLLFNNLLISNAMHGKKNSLLDIFFYIKFVLISTDLLNNCL